MTVFRTFLLCLSLMVFSVACGEDSPDEVDVGCRLNSDCPAEQVCEAGQCVDSDVCVGPQCPCAVDDDCPNGLICNVGDGQCLVPQCAADTDCALGEVCDAGRCNTDVTADRDLDGVPDAQDTCPDVENTDQQDNDADGQGDACDADDDNDGVPDSVDNCALVTNNSQADANGDGIGNACDDDVRGWGVAGRLDFSAGGNPDTNDAQVFVSTRAEPVGVDVDGRFVFEQVLTEVGPFAIRVVWPGFDTLERVFDNAGDGPVLDVGALVLSPEAIGEEGVQMRGVAALQGRQSHQGIFVEALVGGVSVASTLTNPEGGWVLDASRIDHTVVFSADGFEPETIDVRFDRDDARFEVGEEVLEDFAGVVLRPIRDAAIRAQLSSTIAGLDYSDALVVLVDNAARRVIDVEPDGVFGQDALTSGLFGLEIDLPGHEPIRRFETLASGDNDLGRIELTPIEVPMLGSIVVFVDGEAQPVEGVSVRLRREGRLAASTLSDDLGDFIFQALPVGYTLSLRKANFLSQNFAVVFDGDGFTIDGRVLGPDAPLVMVRAPESDRDSDGVIDVLDNCPQAFNADQRDIDGDTQGDACDEDADGDGLANGLDNCPFSFNPMQEDTDGFGRGTACALGSVERPAPVGCGVTRQHLDTRERADRLRGSCGGAGAPEVVYRMAIGPNEGWSIQVDADHASVVYLIDAQGRERACGVGGRLDVEEGESVPEGLYTMVVDGFVGSESAGPVEVSTSSSSCNVFFGLHTGTVSVGSPPSALASGDLDGDGLLDLAMGSEGGISALLGDGRGGFALSPIFDPGVEVVSMVVGDVTGDGRPDIVVTGEGSIGVLAGDGRGGGDGFLSAEVGGTPVSVALGDLNGDGVLDIVAANRLADRVDILLSNGLGGFESPIAADVGSEPLSVAIGDLDGDGALDVVTANSDSDNVSVLSGDGLGQFEPQRTFNAGDNTRSVALGDINADGHLDILTANEGSNIFDGNDGVRSLLGNGRGDFFLQPPVLAGSATVALALADLNGDGRLDFLVEDNDNGLRGVIGDGLGGFAAQSFDVAGGGLFVAGDANGDGLIDVISAGTGSALTVVFGTAFGTFSPKQDFPLGNGPQSVVLEDVNNDGHHDLIAPNFFSDDVSVLLGDGFGRFSLGRTFPVGDAPRSAVVADFNEDGHPDIAVANQNDNSVSVLRGDGAGGFRPLPTVPVGLGPLSVAVGDIDNDGHLDLITPSFDTRQLQPLLGNGNGGFTALRTVGVGSQPSHVTLGDINGDGLLDAVAANKSGNTVSVLLGAGQGNFERQRPFGVGAGPHASALGDVNGDGRLDIVVINRDSDDVSVLIGDETLLFAPHQTFDVGEDPAGVVLEDINGDGRLDIAASSFGDGQVSVLLGDGSGGFVPQIPFSASSIPVSMALADLNSDGQLDVVTTDGQNDSATVLLGRIHQSAGTRFVDAAALPSCPAFSSASQDRSGGVLGFLLTQPTPCRVDRVELELQTEDQGRLLLTTPLDHTAAIESPLSARVQRPETEAPLARLQGHPLNGTWTLTPDFEVTSAQVHINSFPIDPFSSGNLPVTCLSNVDQPADPDFVCRLNGLIDGATLENDGDEDVFLLDGGFGGAFILGQTIDVVVNTDPGAELSVELRAFRASRGLVRAEETIPGRWALSFVVPAEYSGRYLAIHIQDGSAPELSYALSVEISQ